MKINTQSYLPIAALAGLALNAASAHAAVNFSGAGSAVEDFSSTELNFNGDQSNSDLINGLTATAVSGWNTTSGSSVPELNDGIHGGTGIPIAGTWSSVGASVEYNIGISSLGYDITGITSIAAWDSAGFGNQVWTVDVKPVGGTYATLATVDYTPLNNTIGATRVVLSGLDATGIESIRFTAGSAGSNSVGGSFVFREVDVFGTATTVVPEPSSAALLGLGGLALILRRRK